MDDNLKNQYIIELERVQKANEELVNELRRFRIAAEQSIEMMVFADPQGIVFWTNQATERITGFTAKEAIGKKAGVLWGKLMPKAWYANLWDTIKNKKQIFTSEIENHRKNGERFWSTITIYPLLDKKGNIEFFISTQRDITHERDVNRMKNDFISMTSHQLRAPLTAMKWLLGILEDQELGKLSDEQLKAVKDITESNDRMIELVEGLLNISRIESGRMSIEPKPTSLYELVKDMEKEFLINFENKHQKLIIKGDPKLPQIMIDPNLIREVITNLLTNANKYTPDKGKITLTIKDGTKDIEIIVSDTGYGVPANEQPKIFERFYRGSNIAKMDKNGTGLGLYLCKIIVETCGGKIWIKSTEGRGTEVTFTIPKSGMKAKKGVVSISQ